jgi:hypothetical protein
VIGAPFICQSQSLNLFLTEPDIRQDFVYAHLRLETGSKDWMLLFAYKGRRICTKIHRRALPILLGLKISPRKSIAQKWQVRIYCPSTPAAPVGGRKSRRRSHKVRKVSAKTIRAAVRKLGMKPKGRVVLKGGDVPTPAEAAAPTAAAPRVAAAATPASPVYAVLWPLNLHQFPKLRRIVFH